MCQRMNYLLSACCVPSNLLSTLKCLKEDENPLVQELRVLIEEIRCVNTNPLEHNRGDCVLESLRAAGRPQEKRRVCLSMVELRQTERRG